jgi:hypothetical protein
MIINAFYPTTLVLLALGAALRWDTDPFTQCGGDTYQRKRMRRLIGEILLLTAALSLGIAILSSLGLAFLG